jgi:dihydropteroate synthase
VSARPSLVCGGRVFPLGERTFIMGVLNLTPDSFSDGGRFASTGDVVREAQAMVAAGADVLDLGGESTRPGAAPVPVDEELARVLPVVEALVEAGICCLSIDTRNAATARACLDAGASWLNDVSALGHDPAMAEVAARADALVLMHARGEPSTMQQGVIEYGEVVEEVAAFLEERVHMAVAAGVPRERILVDPGIGFGKRLEHNLALTRGLPRFAGIGAGVLYGASRKRFLGELTGIGVASERDAASLGAVSFAAGLGVDVVRVHDVRGAVAAVRVVDALARALRP